MSTFLRRSSKYKSQWLHYYGHRNYFTGSRYAGYVNYFHNENLFGFVVREDAPEREYYFHVTDLHAENIPRVRPLQPVEFSIIEGRGGNFMARDISALGGQPLRYSHANMKMREDDRNRNLSELPNSETERHSGVVVSIMPSGKGGLIVPDRLNFGALGYSSFEIQATGAQRLERFSEVEFFARPSKDHQKDRAVCITRRGGGLITAERRNTGHSRRLLGGMYGPNDIQASIPKDFEHNRRRGYVINYSREKLYGFIIPTDEPSTNGYFVHIDDCHIYGSRFLKRFQEVEFSVVTDASTGKSKALHVSAPNKTVLRSISENRYVPTNLTNNKLPIDDERRYQGSVMVAAPQVNWFLIKPDEKGFEPVIAYKNHVRAMGVKKVQLDDAVEFKVNEPSQEHEHALLRATEISAPGGFPILCEFGPLAKYLQSKIHLSSYQSDLPEYDLSDYQKGTILNGFISLYNREGKYGQIEIESPDQDIRYRRCLFSLDDCVLPSQQIDLENIYIREGSRLQFELNAIDYQNEFETVNRRRIFPPKQQQQSDGDGDGDEEAQEQPQEQEIEYEETEPLIHIKAMNVMSDGMDFLDIQERGQGQMSQFVNKTDAEFNFGDDTRATTNTQRFSRSFDEPRETVKDRKIELNEDADDEDIEDEPLFGDDLDDDEEDVDEKQKEWR